MVMEPTLLDWSDQSGLDNGNWNRTQPLLLSSSPPPAFFLFADEFIHNRFLRLYTAHNPWFSMILWMVNTPPSDDARNLPDAVYPPVSRTHLSTQQNTPLQATVTPMNAPSTLWRRTHENEPDLGNTSSQQDPPCILDSSY